ncbi:MAG: GIDE domain-containing protein [Candidatus Sulfotelmatobacter sp.]
MTLSALILRSSDPTGLLVWCGIGFCAGIGVFFYGFRLLQRRRLILDTPFSKIRSASLGMVEVSGLAVGPYTMVAPITARPCYYYRTLVWEYKQSGKNKQWVKVAGECMHVPFFVDDNTGRVLVDPRGADLDLHRDFEQQFCDSFFTTKDPAPDNVRSFLGRHGIVTNNKIKVEEYCIKPKNSLFILGTLSENPGLEVGPQPIRDVEPINSISTSGFSLSLGSLSSLDGSPRDGFDEDDRAQRLAIQSDAPPHELVRLSPQTAPTSASEMTQQQKVAAALMKAGILNPAAWAAAGVPAAGNVQILADPAASSGNGDGPNGKASPPALANAFDPHPPVVLMKGTNNKTFLISWRSQQEVARSLGWKCALMIWGSPALALLCLYFFLSIQRLL